MRRLLSSRSLYTKTLTPVRNMHIRPFIPTDHHEVAAFTATANWGDEFVDVVFPGRKEHPADLEQHFMRNLKAKDCVPGVVTLVAETDPGDVGPHGQGIDELGGKVVGRMTVQRMGKSMIAERWRRVRPGKWIEAKMLAVEEWYVIAFRLNKAIDRVAQKRHYGRLASLEPQPLKRERFAEMWEVVNLVVDDRYQRRGVAKMLMEWVLRQAQDEGVPVGLRSSSAGKMLYEKLGFECLGDFHWVDGGKAVRQAWMAWCPAKRV